MPTPKVYTEQVLLRLTKQQMADLRAMAQHFNSTVADTIRWAVDTAIQQQKAKGGRQNQGLGSIPGTTASALRSPTASPPRRRHHVFDNTPAAERPGPAHTIFLLPLLPPKADGRTVPDDDILPSGPFFKGRTMDPLERINEVLATLRRRAIERAGAQHPALLAEVAQDHREIAEHERRLEAQRQPAPPPPPKVKTQMELDAEKFEREVQSRVRKAVEELAAERAAQPEE